MDHGNWEWSDIIAVLITIGLMVFGALCVGPLDLTRWL